MAVVGSRWLDGLSRDLRFALRMLRRTPGFTIASVSSLAVGLALTAATAAVVNAYLIRSLPFAQADRLYHVRYAPPGPWEPRGMTALDWRSLADVVEFPITSVNATFYLSDGEFPQSARGLRVGRGFIGGLGVAAAPGRTLGDDDFAGTADRAALIGHALWRGRYGGDPGVVGRELRVEVEGSRGTAETFRVVGVLPADFHFGRDSRDTVDILVPLTSPARTYMVRLRPGVTVGHARQRITDAARLVATGLPHDWTGVELESARERYVKQVRPILRGVTVACGLVLLIACANIAVLMLLRTMRRQKELAVRAALGCARWQLARMLLTEAGLVCAAAAAIGTALTALSLEALAPAIEAQLGRPAPGGASAIAIDSTVLLVVGGAGVTLALAISFLPLLTPWHRHPGDGLRQETSTATGGGPVRHVRSTLVALEVAGTLVLLIGCGLMVQSVIGMLRTDLGFEPGRLVRGRIVLRGSDYADAAAFSSFYRHFIDRLGAAVHAPVVFTNWPPFVERPTHVVESPERVAQGLSAGAISVSAGYFAAFGIELRGGRDFTAGDASGSEPVAVISETLARRLWTAGSPLGRRVRTIEPTPDGNRASTWRTVVGVAEDVRQAYDDTERSDIYVPAMPAGRFGSFYVRTDLPPARLLPEIRSAAAIDAHAMADPPLAVEGENRQLAGTTFLSMLLAGCAAVGGLLAALGIYGVTAYAVQQRRRETAIRIALGAASGVVVRMFMREAAGVVMIGLTAGLLGGITAARVLEARLHGVRAFDVPTLLVTCAVLAVAAMAATWWPARRAALGNPVAALKDG